jgi:hypothetical protein
MRWTRSRITIALAADAAVAALAAGLALAACAPGPASARASRASARASQAGAGAGQAGARASQAGAGAGRHGEETSGAGPVAGMSRASFTWFRAARTPAGWRQAALPGGGAVLTFPPSLSTMPGDAGTVTRGLARAGTVLVYLNVTPRQGDETLPGWASFRVDHLRDDDASSARLDGAATGLTFRGGTGSCAIDDYITRARSHHYREIACYVRGAHRSTVLVAAAPVADWARYAGLLERAVDSYAVS